MHPSAVLYVNCVFQVFFPTVKSDNPKIHVMSSPPVRPKTRRFCKLPRKSSFVFNPSDYVALKWTLNICTKPLLPLCQPHTKPHRWGGGGPLAASQHGDTFLRETPAGNWYYEAGISTDTWALVSDINRTLWKLAAGCNQEKKKKFKRSQWIL